MIAPFPAVAPSDDIAFVVQVATVAALFGTVVAACRRRRDPHADTAILTTRWTWAGAAMGILVLLVARLT